MTQRPALVLTGARQVGKSSLAKYLFPQMRYVSLDLPSDAELAERDPEQFFKLYPPPVIVDEAQYAPGLFRHVKRLIDANRHVRGQFLLTGSQKFELMKEVSDSLAGRISLVELAPLSFDEIKSADPQIDLLSAMLRGGFPELTEDPTLNPTSFYRAYLATYLERDLRRVLNVVHLRDFERFVRACALRTAQVLNKSDLGRDVGISASTANEWLSALVQANQVTLLEPWFSNKTKSMVKSPKLHFRDTGLLCFLLNMTSVDDLRRSPLLGAVWETFVFNELVKRLEIKQTAGSLHYWRDRHTEVDFLRHHGGRIDLWEAKWRELPSLSEADGMKTVRKVLGADVVDHCGIVCSTLHSYPLADWVKVEAIADLLST